MDKKISHTLLTLLLLTSSSMLLGANSATTTTENTWTSKTSMPQTVTGAEAAVVNNKIYVIGGDVNYEYDLEVDVWAAKKPMPTPRSSFGMAVCGDRIYCIGGYLQNGSITATNEVYNAAKDTWETKEPMPTARSQMRAETASQMIFVMGGRTGDQYTTVDSNEAYNPLTDSWTKKAPLPHSVVQYGSTALNGKIFVIGGQDEYEEVCNGGFVQIYNPTTDSWTQGTPHPKPAWLGEAAIATTGLFAPKRIYVMGSSLGIGEASNSNYAYDPEHDTWTIAASMPIPRENFAVANVDDLLYAIGGFNGWTTSYSQNEKYTPFGYGTIPQPAKQEPPPTVTAKPTVTVTEPPLADVQTLSLGLLITVPTLLAIGILYYSKKHP